MRTLTAKRTPRRVVAGLIAGAALAMAPLAAAPIAAADPGSDDLPTCTSVGSGGADVGTDATECQTPGNVQLNDTPPVDPVAPYPWGDEFYGPGLIIGAPGEHGGAGPSAGGGHR